MSGTPRRRFLKGAGAGVVALAVESCADEGPSDAESTEPDLSPITPNFDFYVRSRSTSPEVDIATWQLTIDGAVSRTATLTMADLEALGAQDKEQTLACISGTATTRMIGNAIWSGRPLADVLAAAGVSPTAAAIELQFESADGYETALPIADLDRQAWLVWRMNGEPLPRDHGAPVRLLVPGRYGIKNPKWITRIRLGTEPLLGTWESWGFPNDAPYRPSCLFLSPMSVEVPLGPVALQGCAFCGSIPVTNVEVSVDGGQTWQRADITYEGPTDIWTLWRHDWEPDAPGQYQLLARIECADGQASDPDYVYDLGGYDGYGELSLTVAHE